MSSRNYLYYFFLTYKCTIEIRGNHIIVSDAKGQYCFHTMLYGEEFALALQYAVNRS